MNEKYDHMYAPKIESTKNIAKKAPKVLEKRPLLFNVTNYAKI